MNPAPTYRLHGVRVQCDVPLDEPTDEPGIADIEVRQGDAAETGDDIPPGDMVLQFHQQDGVFYAATRAGDGFLLRFPRLCDFTLSADATSITWHRHEDLDAKFVGMLVKGTVLAFALSLRGHLLLHASAVAIDGAAVAIAGETGMGKSTTAALLCAGGAKLMADDALRVELDTPIVCYPGASSLRLREAAASIVELFDTAPRIGETPDGRVAVSPDVVDGAVPLRAIVVPHPDREIDHVTTEPIRGAEAFWTMARFGRVMGWQEPRMVHQQFAQISRLVGVIPLLRARIPWTQPFTRQTVEELPAAILDGVARVG